MLNRLKLLKHTVGGIFLVAGTTIGAAMLALPVSAGQGGFLPTLLLFLFYWAFMTFTALLFVEVNLSIKHENNFISMARHTLGRWGEVVNWVVYLFLLYALTTAYIAGSAADFQYIIQSLTGYSLPGYLEALPILLLFSFFVYKGAEAVDYANRYMFSALIAVFFLLIILIVPYMDPALLTHMNFGHSRLAISMVATSFGYHIIIPTLSEYVDHDVKMLKRIILIGSAIPLLLYVVWTAVTLSIIPLEGNMGIEQGYQLGIKGTDLLLAAVQSPFLVQLCRALSFLAIITSFLGVSLSLRDFLSDGLRMQTTGWRKLFLYFLTFLPPVGLILLNPRIFLTALELAGAYGVVFLLGFMPALMVYQGRKKGMESPYRAPGGKTALILTMGISVCIMALEFYNQIFG